MSRYPPLTADELRQIYERNPTPEARRLLWEIDRLDELVFAARRFLSTLDQPNLESERLVAFSNLLAIMDAEPRKRRRRIKHQASVKLGCEMVDAFVGPPEYWQVNARRVGESRTKPRR